MFILANNWVRKWMEKECICPAEEFQIFYVLDTPTPRKWSVNLPPWVWVMHSNFLPKGAERGKVEWVTLWWETPQDLSPGIRLTPTVMSHSHLCAKMIPHPFGLPAKMCNPTLIMRKYQKLPNRGTFYEIPDHCSKLTERERSHSVMSDSLRPHGLQPTRLLHPCDFSGKSTGVGCHFLLQEIFPTQGSNPGLLHCRQTLYCLSHQEASQDHQIQEKSETLIGKRSLRTHDYSVYCVIMNRIQGQKKHIR